MTSIYFVGPYRPIMCGIAEYTHFITRKLPSQKWGAISFDLDLYRTPLINEVEAPSKQVWYGIPGREGISASTIEKGLRQLGADPTDSVLWFQHENGIWPDDQKFIAMIKQLRFPKIVTFHTLHFQSEETPVGLRRSQREFLKMLLPHVDAITVFSHGVYRAVTAEFPEYRRKVYVMKHGMHCYPEISTLSQGQARQELQSFLLNRSDLDKRAKTEIKQQGMLLDESHFIIGETGFLSPGKQSGHLYAARDILQPIFPKKKIVAMRIGAARDEHQRAYKTKLLAIANGRDKFLFETCLPEHMLRVAQRAFDLNLYWPKECSQSGIIAHTLGVGGLIAGRDMEGSGEILRKAGAVTSDNFGSLLIMIKNLLDNPELIAKAREKALRYSAEFSWQNQAVSHLELARKIATENARSRRAKTFSALTSDILRESIHMGMATN